MYDILIAIWYQASLQGADISAFLRASHVMNPVYRRHADELLARLLADGPCATTGVQPSIWPVRIAGPKPLTNAGPFAPDIPLPNHHALNRALHPTKLPPMRLVSVDQISQLIADDSRFKVGRNKIGLFDAGRVA